MHRVGDFLKKGGRHRGRVHALQCHLPPGGARVSEGDLQRLVSCVAGVERGEFERVEGVQSPGVGRHAAAPVPHRAHALGVVFRGKAGMKRPERHEALLGGMSKTLAPRMAFALRAAGVSAGAGVCRRGGADAGGGDRGQHLHFLRGQRAVAAPAALPAARPAGADRRAPQEQRQRQPGAAIGAALSSRWSSATARSARWRHSLRSLQPDGAGRSGADSGGAGFVEILRGAGHSPAMGRGFRAEEDKPGGDLVVMISDALWQRRFARDAA
jgi:hypothetical protein